MKNTKVVAGFPGIGKSTLFKENSDLIILDSDSSEFSWKEKGVRHPDFPQNYIDHILDNMGQADIILVSSHDIVRKALKENKINYTLVYPALTCYSEYMDRYKKRGSDEKFIEFIGNNWADFIVDIANEKFPRLVRLEKGQFLKDVINRL